MPRTRQQAAQPPGMLVRGVVHLLVLAGAIGVVAAVLPGVHVHGGFGALMWLALLFALVNAVLGGVLRFAARPLVLLTLGLASFAVSMVVVAVTAALSDALDLDGVRAVAGAAAGIAVLTVVLQAVAARLLGR